MKNTIEKMKLAAMCTVPAALACPVMAYATEPTEAVDVTSTATTALTTALTSMAGSIAEAIGAVLPLAIPLVGAGLVVSIGISVFKRIALKA